LAVLVSKLYRPLSRCFDPNLKLSLPLAAFLEAIILQPTLYWKNARAQNLPFTIDPRIIYRGSAISIINECQLMGIQFGFTAYFHRILDRRSDHDRTAADTSYSQHLMLSSICGGLFSSITASPAELVSFSIDSMYG
jgi:hypothetical protein